MNDSLFCRHISSKLAISHNGVAAVLRLLFEGASVPFIARYRKEKTGGLDEVAIGAISKLYDSMCELEKRKTYVIESIERQNKLTPELRQKIKECLDGSLLEDIYSPYRQGRRTKASVARDHGLEPFAKIIMAQRTDSLRTIAKKFICEVVPDVDSAIDGACDIIAEWISNDIRLKNKLRKIYSSSAVISSTVVDGKEYDGIKYSNYFNFSEPLMRCPSHRFLAISRGNREGVLKIRLHVDDEKSITTIVRDIIRPTASCEIKELINNAIRDSYRRLIKPSLENELLSTVKKKSDSEAIAMFAQGLRQLLMSPPMSGRRILAVDPGYRTGCKIVCLNSQGDLLAHDVIYPCAPRNDINTSATKISELHKLFKFDTVAIGNGTASRETLDFFRSLSFDAELDIRVVSEQGASIYSASDVARREFPNEDITVRGAVSIGRRLLDSLAELVKIAPQSIGVGQYQHDVNQTELSSALDFVVSSCVNQVGVNVNTASVELLSYVSGISKSMAEAIIAYRKANGPFNTRKDILRVPRLGTKTFQQCAGFLCVPGSKCPLDATRIHPECYPIVEAMARDAGADVLSLIGNAALVDGVEISRYVNNETGLPTLRDIVDELKNPWRDPRVIPPEIILNESIRSITDLSSGMVLYGRISNITAFGAFVDIGIKENGLVHISELSDRFVKNVSDVVEVGQQVSVKVLDVDQSRGRISLTMKFH